jgi:hypothetical protein
LVDEKSDVNLVPIEDLQRPLSGSTKITNVGLTYFLNKTKYYVVCSFGCAKYLSSCPHEIKLKTSIT